MAIHSPLHSIICGRTGEAKIDKSYPALFLHGGPGMSAGVERLWFGNSLPICWWDQPVVVAGDSPSPFDQLVAAAANQLRSMTAAAGGSIPLIAHSFGGQIAHALARQVPALVRSITLLGCVTDPFPPLFRLCRRMNELHRSAGLELAMADAQADLNKRSFEAMILAGAAHPAYPAVYFGPDSTATGDRFLALLPQVRFLHLETFFAVMNDMLNAPALAPVQGFDGEVRLLLGRHDPVHAIDEDIAAWQRLLPQIRTQVVDAGHFLHLELSPEIWWET